MGAHVNRPGALSPRPLSRRRPGECAGKTGEPPFQEGGLDGFSGCGLSVTPGRVVDYVTLLVLTIRAITAMMSIAPTAMTVHSR